MVGREVSDLVAAEGAASSAATAVRGRQRAAIETALPAGRTRILSRTVTRQ
jgi:hypothetical protein